MALPEILTFEDIAPGRSVACYYERLGHRAPRKGEFYVSGAIPAAYKARADLSSEYLVVKPTHYAVAKTVHERGPRVTGV